MEIPYPDQYKSKFKKIIRLLLCEIKGLFRSDSIPSPQMQMWYPLSLIIQSKKRRLSNAVDVVPAMAVDRSAFPGADYCLMSRHGTESSF